MSDAHALFQEALFLPDSLARLEALERAIRAADAQNVDDVSVEAREEMLETAFYVSDPERTLSSFTWLLARHDRLGAADAGKADDLLWQYKWVVGALTDFPQVGRGRIAAVLDDLERRFRAHGNQMRGVHAVRCKIALRLGDLDVAGVELEKMRAVPRDRLADCRACEADQEVEVLIALDRLPEARVAAAPILAGQLRCAEVPAWTFAHLVVPVLEAGDIDDAVALHRRGLPASNELGDKAAVLAHHHIQFLAMTGNLAAGLRLVRKHWSRTATPRDPELQMRFHASLALLATRLRQSGKKTVLVRAPPHITIPQAAGRIDVEDLVAFATADALAIAARYDHRNGNDRSTANVQRVIARANTSLERRVTREESDDSDD